MTEREAAKEAAEQQSAQAAKQNRDAERSSYSNISSFKANHILAWSGGAIVALAVLRKPAATWQIPRRRACHKRGLVRSHKDLQGGPGPVKRLGS